MEDLTAAATGVYRYALRHPDWSIDTAARALELPTGEVEAAVALLRTWCLLLPARHDRHRYSAVSPGTAAAELLYEQEATLRAKEATLRAQEAELAHQRHQLLSLAPHYDQALERGAGGEGVEVIIADPASLRRRVGDSASVVQTEVLVLHPGGGLSADSLVASLRNDLPLLARGVGLRILLQHATRHHVDTQRYVRAVTEEGAIVRTVAALPRRLLVFDGDVAFVPAAAGADVGAVAVTERGLVEFARSVFEVLWAQGRPYPVDHQAGVDVRDDITRSVLEMLRDGRKDEVIARRLGISVRTCRKRIAMIMEELGASSRFQAGALAADRGLLD